MADEPWTLAIEAQDHQWELTGASLGKQSVCQVPSG